MFRDLAIIIASYTVEPITKFHNPEFCREMFQFKFLNKDKVIMSRQIDNSTGKPRAGIIPIESGINSDDKRKLDLFNFYPTFFLIENFDKIRYKQDVNNFVTNLTMY